jgi:3,4-dihydroxy 2-butanone 4-phosphate synthase/GTP cyclohydrolase II
VTVNEVLEWFASGRPLMLTNDDGACELAVAADRITTKTMAEIVRIGTGFVRVVLPEATCDRLLLPLQTWRWTTGGSAGDCVTVDAATGVTTGISAADRALTARLLASADTHPADLRRPGHVVPQRVTPVGSLGRLTAHEAAVVLASLSGCAPGAVVSAITSQVDPRRLAGIAELPDLAERYAVPVIRAANVADCARWRGAAGRAMRGVLVSAPKDAG